MRVVQVYLLLASAVCLGLAIMGLLFPQANAQLLLHVTLPDTALGEWRARSGGVLLVLACFCCYAALTARGQVSAVLMLVLVSGGLLCARLLSLLLDGWPSAWGAGLTILEAGILLLGLRLLLRWPSH